MEEAPPKSVDLERWMADTFVFDGLAADVLIEVLEGMLAVRRYIVKAEQDTDTEWSVTAYWGRWWVKPLSPY